MLSTKDQENLRRAQQSTSLAVSALRQLASADNPLLAEIAIDQLEALAKIDLKMQRLLSLQS